MYDPSPQRGPANATEWWISAGFLAILLGLFAAEIYSDYTPAKLSALLFLGFYVPLLVLHEFGHAVAAYALGWRVAQIVIGMGRTIARFRVGTADVEIRLLAIEGFVRCAPKRLRWPRVESAINYFAGPGVELLLALGILCFVGPNRLLSAADEHVLVFWQSLAFAATFQAAMNLIPFAVHTPDRALASDGLGIVLSFLWPRSYYAEMMRHAEEQRVSKRA
jgi:hypothetical protein